MNTMKDLIEALEYACNLLDRLPRHSDLDTPDNPGETASTVRMGRRVLAAVKEEQKVLADEEIERLRNDYFLSNRDAISPTNRANGFSDGLRYARDNNYLAPASGLTVEGVKQQLYRLRGIEPFISDHKVVEVFQSALYPAIKALEDLAENGGGNLRTDPWISVQRVTELVPTTGIYITLCPHGYEIDFVDHRKMLDAYMADCDLVKASECRSYSDDIDVDEGTLKIVEAVRGLDVEIPAPPDNTNKG